MMKITMNCNKETGSITLQFLITLFTGSFVPFPRKHTDNQLKCCGHVWNSGSNNHSRFPLMGSKTRFMRVHATETCTAQVLCSGNRVCRSVMWVTWMFLPFGASLLQLHLQPYWRPQENWVDLLLGLRSLRWRPLPTATRPRSSSCPAREVVRNPRWGSATTRPFLQS